MTQEENQQHEKGVKILPSQQAKLNVCFINGTLSIIHGQGGGVNAKLMQSLLDDQK